MTRRPSTRASSAPGRTIAASARPPTSSSIASTSIVLPAPVSPVTAVSPVPSTSSMRSMTPRFSMCSSVSISGRPGRTWPSGSGGTDAPPKRTKLAVAADGAQRTTSPSSSAAHRAAVHRAMTRRRSPMHLDLDHLGGVEHERAVEQHVRRRPGVSSRARWRRRHDRAACRQRVRGRARRRRDDQPVGGVVRERFAVDARQQTNGVSGLGLLDDCLVEGPPHQRSPSQSAATSSIIRSSRCQPPASAPATNWSRPRRAPIGLDLGEIAERPEVHAQQRHGCAFEQPDRAEHGAVATEAHDQVGLARRPSLAGRARSSRRRRLVGRHPERECRGLDTTAAPRRAQRPGVGAFVMGDERDAPASPAPCRCRSRGRGTRRCRRRR